MSRGRVNRIVLLVGVTAAAACGSTSGTASDTAPSTSVSLPATIPVTHQDAQSPPPSSPRCPEWWSPEGQPMRDVSATIEPLSVTAGPATTYADPDVVHPGYTIHDETGEEQTLDIGIAMLFILTSDGEVISGPDGVDMIGITVEVPASGDAVAPFVWSPVDCRTGQPVEPGTYRGVLDLSGTGTITVDELVVTP